MKRRLSFLVSSNEESVYFNKLTTHKHTPLHSNSEVWIIGDEKAKASKALLFPSPHICGSYSFMTKPIHALTAYVLTDVWCRLLPWSLQCATGSLLPCTHPTSAYHFSSGWIWSWVSGFIHIHDSFDTWQQKCADGGERQKICLRSHVWERWPHHVNMNEGGKLMLLPVLPLSLSLLFIHISFREHTTPAVSVRPGKCRGRVATDEYDCPLCLPRFPCRRKSELFVMPFEMVRVNL